MPKPTFNPDVDVTSRDTTNFYKSSGYQHKTPPTMTTNVRYGQICDIGFRRGFRVYGVFKNSPSPFTDENTYNAQGLDKLNDNRPKIAASQILRSYRHPFSGVFL
jgi:hypothetical protein